MTTVPAPALHDLIPLGDHILDDYVEVRKRRMQHQDELPYAFWPLDVLIGFVGNEIRSEYLVDEVQVPLADDFLPVAKNDGLVFLCIFVHLCWPPIQMVRL